jgi:peroxiredoxin
MFKNYLIAILSALLLFVAYQKYFDKFSDMQSIGTVEDFTLLDHSGVSHNLHYLGDKKAIVLVSYGIGCPIARHSLFTLNELRRRFKNDNVEFLLLDANFGDDRNNLQEEAKEFSIDLPILIDDSQTIAQSLNIERTAEAILIDPKTWSIIYRGSIDDRLGYETQKTKATNNYLAQAISDLLKRKTPEVQRTATKGCLINYLKTPSQISYSEQIVPILRDNCLTCHNQSGIGPWSMSDFKTIHSWSKMIREVVRQKRMPPREVDPYFSTVKNNRSLTAEEKRLLISWIEQGAKKDSADDPLPTLHQKVAQTKWPLGEPDIIIKAEEVTKLPATGVLDWIQRYQTSPIDRDIWAKAIYYLPSNKKVVHHASFWAKIASPYQTATAYNVASTVEEVKQWVESRKNNTEFVPPEKSADWEMVQGYAPGLKMFTFPEGTGKFFPRGTELLFITHYLTTGKPEEDQPEVGIYLYKEPNPKVKPLVHKFLENNLW